MKKNKKVITILTGVVCVAAIGGIILINGMNNSPDVNNNTNDTNTEIENANNTIKFDTGKYVGQIDSNSIEVKVSGAKEGVSERVFRLKEEFKDEFNSLNLEQDEEIKLQYTIDDNNQPVVFKIERINVSETNNLENVKSDFAFMIEGNKSISIMQWDNEININDILGKPKSANVETIGEEGDTFAGSRIKTIQYDGFEIKLMSPKNKENFYILSMMTTKDIYKTARDIKVGDSLDKMLNVYNGIQKVETGDRTKDLYRYVEEGTNYIQFTVANKKVNEIEIGYESH